MASGSINKAYSEEDLTNIDKTQFALETKINQEPLENKEVLPEIKETQYENGLHNLNSSKDKFR